MENNIIKDTKLGVNGVPLSHLQFTDDTIIFCNNDVEEMGNIKRILRCFQLMSGLKINYSKSSLCGINVRQEDVTSLAQIMGCKSEGLPIKYLGLPLGANPNRIKTWDPVVEKTQSRLNKWNGRFISTRGRLTLMNSNTGNLLVYYMSLFKMSGAVAKKLEQLQRQFFWGDTVNKRKMHIVKWEDITMKKSNGGLRIKRLMQQNMALLAKWCWKFGNDKEALWVRVIRRKYNLDDNSQLPYTHGAGAISTIWRDFCGLECVSSCLGYSVRDRFKIQVGSGTTTLFWEHAWMGDVPLREEYPRLFSVSNQKDTLISNLVGGINGQHWELTFRRLLFIWETQQLQQLRQRL